MYSAAVIIIITIHAGFCSTFKNSYKVFYKFKMKNCKTVKQFKAFSRMLTFYRINENLANIQ